MITIEVYKNKGYRKVRTVRSRGEAFLRLSLLGATGRAKDAGGNVIAKRDSAGKLSLVKA